MTALKKAAPCLVRRRTLLASGRSLKIADNDVFGAGVDKAVRRSQARAALTVDGEVETTDAGSHEGQARQGEPRRLRGPGVPGHSAREGQRRERAARPRLADTRRFRRRRRRRLVGAATTQALRAFQAKRGLPTTGIVETKQRTPRSSHRWWPPWRRSRRRRLSASSCSPAPSSTSVSIRVRSEAGTAAPGCASSPTARKATGSPGAQALRPSASSKPVKRSASRYRCSEERWRATRSLRRPGTAFVKGAGVAAGMIVPRLHTSCNRRQAVRRSRLAPPHRPQDSAG